MSGSVSLSGNLYAAAASLDWSSNADAYGSIYAGDFNASSSVRIHYDRQVAQAGQGCPGAPTTDAGIVGCNSCTDCNNQACISGACGGMCTNNSQCCPPLVCSNGGCVLPIQ